MLTVSFCIEKCLKTNGFFVVNPEPFIFKGFLLYNKCIHLVQFYGKSGTFGTYRS